MAKHFLPRLILLIFLFSSCKFSSSPYVAETPNIRRNEVALGRIKQSEQPFGEDFKVAVLSDTHNYYQELNEAIDLINRTGPYAFVVITGDITNYGVLSEFEESLRFFNKLESPFLVLIGNHDILGNGDIIFKRMFGATDFAFTYRDVLFVLFNNSNWESRGRVPNYSWVESQLRETPSSSRVLFTHVSPDDSDRFTPQEVEEWIDLVTNYNVNYVIHGHKHNPREDTFGSAVKLIVGSLSKNVFQVLHFSSGGVTHQKISF